MKRVLCLILSLLVLFVLLVFFEPNARTWVSDLLLLYRSNIDRERGIMMPMRDSTKLRTNIYLPADDSEVVFPTILIRNTYSAFPFDTAKWLVSNGYAVVEQFVRGRHGSEGEYSPHRYSGSDGYDTVDWIVKQPWSDGKIGSFGCSYLGETQVILGAERHPNHIAMIADAAGGAIGKAKNSFAYFGFYENGVLNLASTLGWFSRYGAINDSYEEPVGEFEKRLAKVITELPVIALASKIVPDHKTQFEAFVSHSLSDSWWEDEGYISNDDQFSVATLHVNTWFDQGVQGSFLLAELMQENASHVRAKKQHLLIGPGNHCSSGKLSGDTVRIGDMAIEYEPINYNKIYLDWFDHWLKDKPVPLPPKISYFDIHGDKWQSADLWPPADVEQLSFFLKSGNSLSLEPLSQTSSLGYDYNPLDPVPTLGGSICCTGDSQEISGAVDQRVILERKDVLSFISEPLTKSLDVAGTPLMRLYVSTSAKDTDFTVKLIDQYPDGTAYNLIDSVGRLRYREGFDKPKLAEAGKVYEIDIELKPMSYRIRKGHRLGVMVSSSNFPRLARNLNTGEREYFSKNYVVAHNQVYFGGEVSSRLFLPVTR